MAIRWIGTSHKTALEGYPSTDRVYLDFRQYAYPPVLAGSALTYTLVTSAANQPGSHNLTGGVADYLLEMPSVFTVFVRAQAQFTVAVAADQTLLSWYATASHYCWLGYTAAADQIQLRYDHGSAVAAVLVSTTYTATELSGWKNIACAVKLDVASTTGSYLYIDQVVHDAAWSATIEAATYVRPVLGLLHNATSVASGWDVNQVRLFSGIIASATDVANIFKDRKEEEVVWNFNGEGCGRTRCNVTRWVTSTELQRSIEEPTNGSQGANKWNASIKSPLGQFADDQYAAFDPTLDQFNGLTEKYLQKRSRVEAETWYGTVWEPYFIGRLDEGMYKRTSTVNDVTRVTLAAEDTVSDIARTRKRRSRSFKDYSLSDPASESTSLFHEITRLATRTDVYNFLANSSFENTTVANSWTVGGTSATFARVAGGLFGSYQGDLVVTSVTASVGQVVTFTGEKKVNVGELWNFSAFFKSATTVTTTIHIAELSSASAVLDTTTTAFVVGLGTGWKRQEVTHTLTESATDRLQVVVRALTTTVTLSVDGAQLVQSSRALPFWALNDNDGASGVESADDADYGSYDTVGFDADAVAVVHPWVFVQSADSVWDHLKDLADATGCMYMGMDAGGALRLRSRLKTGYADPSTLTTIDTVISVDSQIELRRANKILGHGVRVRVDDKRTVVWMLSASGIAGPTPSVEIENGEYFPDVISVEFSEFWARYGTVV